MNRFALTQKATPTLALSVVLLASLAACGGGASPDQSAQAAPAAESSAAQPADAALDPAVVAAIDQTEVLPAYHLTPALLDEPAQVDVGGTSNSARMSPKSFSVDAGVAALDTARLSRQALVQRLSDAAGKARIASVGSEGAAPQAATITGAVYTPAQIRAAYGLATLPAAGASLTTAQSAALGAGATIYIVDSGHDASSLSDLNAFSTRFGLPTCANVPVAATATLPLAKAPSTCTFSQVYATTAGSLTSTAPAYNSLWAPESKLDVQWAHAIAPLARIVLIEMASTSSSAILGASALAAKMGSGVVSMSFGSAEQAWSPTVERYFAVAGMTFVAAAGDTGTQVLWPAVSPNVLAVGGTGLNWSGSGTRYEAAWNHSGGGMSAYAALPSWQSGVTPTGGSALVRRAVPDVAFNANPLTGEYVALTLPGATTTTWQAYGGTSIAAPQWAGIVAVANAIRLANGKAVLGDIHSLLYKSIATTPGTYAASLGDVVDGTNGTCTTCKAGAGFDQITGWGTPSAAGLLPVLTGVSTTQAAPAAAPTVPGGSISGSVGTALSHPLGVTAPSGVTPTFAVSGAPSGVAIDSTGTLKWSAPVIGSWSFNVTATAAGKSASGTYALKISANGTPAFTSGGKYSGTAGKAFTGTLSASNPNNGTLSYTASGAPSGLAVASNGAISWAAPVAGTWTFTAKVTDSFGYASTQTESITIAAPAVATPPAPA